MVPMLGLMLVLRRKNRVRAGRDFVNKYPVEVKSMECPQSSQWGSSSGDSSSESSSGRLVRVVFSQWVYVS